MRGWLQRKGSVGRNTKTVLRSNVRMRNDAQLTNRRRYAVVNYNDASIALLELGSRNEYT